jgi:tetratricopeptide (TPR) repeat protein
MKAAHEIHLLIINLYKKMSELALRFPKKVYIFALILPVSFSVPLTSAIAPKAVPDQESAVRPDHTEDFPFNQARQLIEKDENNRTNMQQAAVLLETIKSQYPEDIRIPLYLAEAYYRMADPEADIKKTFPYFEKAGYYASQALKLNPDSPKAHYWNGLYLLRKAQNAWMLGAYGLTKEGIQELEIVRDILPSYDHGGASRALGLICYMAPGWSPFGDIDKAIRLEKEATRIAPDYLLNRLYLAKAYQKQGDKEATIREYKKMLTTHSDSIRYPSAVRLQVHVREVLASLGEDVD